MHSSDETGDERKGLASTGGAAEAETAKLPAHAFRERIRRASVAAAQSAHSDQSDHPAHPSAGTTGSHPALLAPEQSGVHDRASDAPPEAASENSPQSGAPEQPTEQLKSDSAREPAAAVSVQNQSSRSWPFAGGPAGPAGQDERRLHQHTQVGVGGPRPQRAAAAGGSSSLESAKPDSAAEESDARRRMDTRDTKRSRAGLATRASGAVARSSKSNPPPPPSKSTPPRPFRAKEANWSPTSTKPQRASLLRADASKSDDRAFTKTRREGPRANAGAQEQASAQEQQQLQQHARELGPYTLSALADEYLEVSVDAHGLSISATDPADEDQPQETDSAQSADAEAASGEAPQGTRARRYTPKQRGRGRDRSAGDEQRAEYAATVPDLRSAFTPTNKTVRGQGPQAQSFPPSLPATGNQLRLNQLGQLDPRLSQAAPSQPVTPDTPTQPRGRPVPRLPLVASPPVLMNATNPAFAHPAAFNNARQPQAQGPARPTPRSPFAPVATQRGASASQVPQHEASIVVDPSLHAHVAQVTEARAPQRTDVRPVRQPYQPLPSDPAAFEQMMRDQAAARGARLNWKQQATLVIPRDDLEAPVEQRLFTPKMLLGFVGATLVGALVMLGINRYGDAGAAHRVGTDTSTSAAAASNSVVIATEPSGAELLLDGAVVGNTPLEVPRPPRGQAELTYVIRMRGFTQELIRLSAESQPAIRVTLTPDSGVQ